MEAALHNEIIRSKTVSCAVGVFAFVILTCLGAFVRIPIPATPVPITLQTFFVLLSGAVLRRRLGAISQASYLLLGIAGLPVFTGAGSGFSYLTGPTAGYLIGFVVAAACIGWAIENARTAIAVFIVFCLADGILLCLGAFWLKLLLGCSFIHAASIGVVPFIWGDFVKAALAAALYQKIRARCTEIF